MTTKLIIRWEKNWKCHILDDEMCLEEKQNFVRKTPRPRVVHFIIFCLLTKSWSITQWLLSRGLKVIKYTILTHGKMLSLILFIFLINICVDYDEQFFAEDKFPFHLGDRRQLLETFLNSVELDFCIFLQFCSSSMQICTPECVEHVCQLVQVEAKDNFQEFIFSASRWLSVDRTKDIRLAASPFVWWAILQTLKVALITNESYYSKIRKYIALQFKLIQNRKKCECVHQVNTKLINSVKFYI